MASVTDQTATDGGIWGPIRTKSRWTVATVVVLALFALSSAWAAFSLEVDPMYQLVAIELLLVLAVVAWMETKWGTLLVAVVGLLVFVQEIVTVTVSPNPAYGPQSGQYAYAVGVLLIPLFAYLSYRNSSSR